MLALLLLAQSAPMTATPPIDCSHVRVALPPSLAGWGNEAGAPNIGRAFTMTAISPATQAKRPGKVATAKFHVATNGAYSVALDQPAWIDLATGGNTLASAAHRHGPACSGIRKVVDFALVPGDYVVTISGLSSASAKVLIAPSR